MAVEYVPNNLTEHQIAELWDGYAAGLHQSEILSAQVPSSS
jgi:hypothetical protein